MITAVRILLQNLLFLVFFFLGLGFLGRFLFQVLFAIVDAVVVFIDEIVILLLGRLFGFRILKVLPGRFLFHCRFFDIRLLHFFLHGESRSAEGEKKQCAEYVSNISFHNFTPLSVKL